MSAIGELRFYVLKLQRRLRWGTVLRGATLLTASALATTVALTLIINRFAFSSASVWGARAILTVTLAVGAAFGLALPLWRLNRRWSARRAERTFPEFRERLLTFTERDADRHEPFLELLARDTMRIARSTDVRAVAPGAVLLALLGVGAACLGTLVWLIEARPGYVGYGAAALWSGRPSTPLYDLAVKPGDATIRRHSDQLVTATTVGFATDQIQVYARYPGASGWERLSMQPQPRAAGFQFLFPSVAEDLEYYVRAGALESRHYQLRVVDVASVKQIRVTYRYPAWTRLADLTEEHGGDLRAVEGTQAQLEVRTDHPLTDGVLVLDDGRQIRLASAGNDVYRGIVPIEKDGAYHVAGHDRAQLVRISEDYYIEAGEVKPPEVAIVRPAQDYRASPIEEVTIGAQASDAFGLTDLTLHYSVNGGVERSVKLLPHAGARQASGATLISLESLNLVPGDVVSFYAAARDARGEARTNIAFIQAEPFEREFSQSQSGGGGGGGAGNAGADISRREKEIIAATWQQARLKDAPVRQAAEQAKFLSDVQTTLAAQALSLAARLEMRDLNQANGAFSGFQQDMQAAADAMGPAAQQLQAQKWDGALPDEQKALQHLLRAEATFRQIQVAFGSAARGSGSPDSAGRDLASLFDLELDTQKNQYETGQDQTPERKRYEEIDAALRKLDELARRESELAGQPRDSAQAAEQRWQQEMLRRNAEELRRQLEQLARTGEAGSQSSSSSEGSQSETAQREGGQSATRAGGGAQQGVQRALSELRQAEEEMRRAVDRQDQAGARRAAEHLRQAMAELGGRQLDANGRELDELAREAGRLADEEHRQAQALGGAPAGGSPRSARERSAPGDDSLRESLLDDRQKLADDLAQLTQRLRTAEHAASAQSKGAGSKLRDALNDLDQSDTETSLQRSADLLRRGFGLAGQSAEPEIQAALQRLRDQLREARQALSQEGAPSEEALAAIDRFRGRLAALDRSARGAEGGVTGGVQRGGGGGEGFINGGWNAGNNAELPQAAAPEHSPPPRPSERSYREGMDELGQLRHAVGEDPAARAEVDELIRSMQKLDPRRFPGNPAMVDELYARVHSEVDRLELQLRQQQDPAAGRVTDIRGEAPAAVPAGYQSAVAEYFRRLSKAP